MAGGTAAFFAGAAGFGFDGPGAAAGALVKRPLGLLMSKWLLARVSWSRLESALGLSVNLEEYRSCRVRVGEG